MTIITIITLFGTLTGTSGQLTDLCDITNPDTDTPILCEPHPDGAPVWDATVCCNDKDCVQPDALGACAGERQAYFCDRGELMTDDTVSCYFEVPNYCDVYPCSPGYGGWPQGNMMCCYEGICWNIWHGSNDCERSDIHWCNDGVTNNDGTVTCFDEEP